MTSRTVRREADGAQALQRCVHADSSCSRQCHLAYRGQFDGSSQKSDVRNSADLRARPMRCSREACYDSRGRAGLHISGTGERAGDYKPNLRRFSSSRETAFAEASARRRGTEPEPNRNPFSVSKLGWRPWSLRLHRSYCKSGSRSRLVEVCYARARSRFEAIPRCGGGTNTSAVTANAR